MPIQQGSKRGLVGGAAGEPEDSFANPFVHTGIKAVNLMRKNTYGVRLLPAFDMNLDPASDEFATSFIPYRDETKKDPESGLPVFTSWYYVVRGYKFIGNSKQAFLSPLTLEARDQLGIDPLFDMYRVAKNSKNDDWKFLTEKPQNVAEGYGAPLPYIGQHVLSNALVNIEGNVENRLVVYGVAGLKMLKQYLNLLRPSIEKNPVDPNWPDYLYGDVTSPEYGLWATVKETKYNDAASCAAFNFSAQRDRLVNHTPYPLDINSEDGISALRGRYNISDTDRVTKIWSAEEILDFLVRDGFYPYALIQEACARNWTIPPESTQPKHVDMGGGGKIGGAKQAADQGEGTDLGPSESAPAAKPAGLRPPPRPGGPPAGGFAKPPQQAARPTQAAPARAAAPQRAPSPGAPPPRQAPPRPNTAPPQRPAPAAAPARAAAKPAPSPAPAPVEPEPVDPASEASEPAVFTQADEDAYQALEAKFLADSNAMSSDEMQEYARLGDLRVAASVQQ